MEDANKVVQRKAVLIIIRTLLPLSTFYAGLNTFLYRNVFKWFSLVFIFCVYTWKGSATATKRRLLLKIVSQFWYLELAGVENVWKIKSAIVKAERITVIIIHFIWYNATFIFVRGTSKYIKRIVVDNRTT